MFNVDESPSRCNTFVVPSSVRALDAWLNRRVLTASSDEDLADALRAKVAIKRAIVSMPDPLIDGAAQTILTELKANHVA